MIHQYRSMNAYVDYTPNRIIFISYNTPIIVVKNGNFYAWRLQYSPTTSKQTINWLRDEFNATKKDVIMVSRDKFNELCRDSV